MIEEEDKSNPQASKCDFREQYKRKFYASSSQTFWGHNIYKGFKKCQPCGMYV